MESRGRGRNCKCVGDCCDSLGPNLFGPGRGDRCLHDYTCSHCWDTLAILDEAYQMNEMYNAQKKAEAILAQQKKQRDLHEEYSHKFLDALSELSQELKEKEKIVETLAPSNFWVKE